MTSETTYQVPADVLVAHLKGEAVLLHMDTKRYYRLNDTAAWIWRSLEQRARLNDIVHSLCGEFEVTPLEAERETQRVLGELMERGLLSRTDGPLRPGSR